MNFVANVEKKEFENFVKNHKIKSHFLQSYEWGQFSKDYKNCTPYYVGMKNEKNKLVATALLLERKLPLGYSYFYCPRGFVLDYNNFNLLKEFTINIKKFIKTRKAIFLKIDPDIKRHDLDVNGKHIEEGNNNYKLIEYLKSIDFKHLGFNKNFERNQPRYTFRLNIDKSIEEITKDFNSTTRNIVNRDNVFELELVKNNINTIDDFYITMMETQKREKITNYSREYYKNFYKYLHKSNSSDLYVVYANIKKLKLIHKDKIKDLNDKILCLSENTIKNSNKIKEFNNQLQKATKTYESLSNISSDRLPLSAMITAKYGDKVWTVHGGNHGLLRDLNANYFMYYEIIKDAVKEKYKIIDFFGTVYNPTKDSPEFGLHSFKKRFSGEYTEFIGEFDLVNKKVIYFIFTSLIPLYRKVVKKIKRAKEN